MLEHVLCEDFVERARRQHRQRHDVGNEVGLVYRVQVHVEVAFPAIVAAADIDLAQQRIGKACGGSGFGHRFDIGSNECDRRRPEY